MSEEVNAGPSHSEGDIEVIRDMVINEHVHAVIPSPNYNERAAPISMVVLHYTG